MLKRPAVRGPQARSVEPAVYPEDLEPAVQRALLALAHIDSWYEQDLASLQAWSGPDGIKERLAQEVEDRHCRDRAPLVRELADLHQRMMAATAYGKLAFAH